MTSGGEFPISTSNLRFQYLKMPTRPHNLSDRVSNIRSASMTAPSRQTSTFYPPVLQRQAMNSTSLFRRSMEDERDDSLVFPASHRTFPQRVVFERNVIRDVPIHRNALLNNSSWQETRNTNNHRWCAQPFQGTRRYTNQEWTYPRPVSSLSRERNELERWRRVGSQRFVPMTESTRVSHLPPASQEVPMTVSNDESPTVSEKIRHDKRTLSSSGDAFMPDNKKVKGFDRLDLLVTATLEMGPLLENTAGCSCPKSKCVALYCDCFKAGRRCDPHTCNCLDCKNTINESGPEGARTKAIRSILTRNPRAFLTAGVGKEPPKLPPGEVACNCIRSRCLKLYCTCFQVGKICNPEVCTCISCLNTKEDMSGDRQHAIQMCLEKRPDAFQTKTKPVGLGCACKNNKCVRKYCECFREKLLCTDKCSCLNCENNSNKDRVSSESQNVCDI